MAKLPLPKGPSAARIGQLRNSRGSARFRRAAGRLGKRAAVGAGSMLLDFLIGFFDIQFKDEKSKKLGLFGKALGAGISTGGVDSLPLPSMEKPKQVSRIANPTIATISGQLDELVRTANKIGVFTKEQQEALLGQIAQSKRLAKEQQLENKVPSIPVTPDMGEASNLEPLDESITGLIKKIDDLSATIDGVNGQGGLFGGQPGLLGSPVIGLGKGGKAPKAPKVVRSATSPTGYRYAAGSGKGGQYAPKPGLFARATSAISTGASTTAAKVRGSAIVSSAASTRVAGLMSRGIKNAAVKVTGVKEAVKRIAGPIIGKAVGKTALKSIPLVGAGIGAAFAIGRLLQGDVVGAGLDLTSGLAGPLTAIPALAASVARDTYAGVYGVQPEQDPNFSERFAGIKTAVEELIRQELNGTVKPKAGPTEREIGDKETPAKPPQSATAVRSPPAVPSAAAAAASATGGGGAAGGGAGAGTAGGGAEAASSSPAPAAAAATPAPAPAPESAAPAQGEALAQAAATPQDLNQMTGTILNAQQIPVSPMWENYGFDRGTGTFVPQRGPSSRLGAQRGSKGNIPSPIYLAEGLEGLHRTLFFNY